MNSLAPLRTRFRRRRPLQAGAAAPKYQKERLLTTSDIDPDRKSQLSAPEYKTFAPAVQAGLAGALEQSLAWPTSPESPKRQQKLADELALVLAKSKTPAQALADTHQAWNAILKKKSGGRQTTSDSALALRPLGSTSRRHPATSGARQ